MNVDIVLLGGARRVTLLEQFQSIAASHGVTARFHSVEKDNGFYPISGYARVLAGPTFAGDQFDRFLDAEFGHMPNLLLVACMDAAIPSMARFAVKQKAQGRKVVAPRLEGAEIALDKALTAKFCAERSIRHPQCFSPHDQFAGRVLAKPKQGFGGKGIYVFDRLKEVDPALFATHVVQQFVEGPETTHDVYISEDGSFQSSSRVRLAVIDGEVDHCIVRKPTESELSTFRNIAQSGLFEGPLTVQTICQDGEDYLIEINARLGGGVTASIEAGYPAVELLLAQTFGIEPRIRKFQKLEMKRARRDFYRIIA